ncbi:MAG: hypothetical protein M3Y44_00510 [Actinomycetota bacterium]|nr:hypothetical protein [Actinomycetota bacterium]
MPQSSDARLANLLGALATGLTDNVDACAAAAELDRTAAVALVALLDFTPSGSVQMLSQIVGLTHAGGVRLVNRLVQGEYVARTPGDDARSIRVQLTSKGRRKALQLRKHRESAITAAIAGLTEQQRDDLTRACELLITNLTDQRLTQRARDTPLPGGALCRMCDFTACGRPEGQCPAACAAANVGPRTPAPPRRASGDRRQV